MANWSCRIDEDTKQILKGLSKGFENQQEFMDTLIKCYELQTIKKESLLQPEIVELQKLTSRINEIFINADSKITLSLESISFQKGYQEQEFNREIHTKQTQIDTLTASNSKLNEKLSTLHSKFSELDTAYKSTQELVRMYKKEIETNEVTILAQKEELDRLNDIEEKLKKETKKLEDATKRIHSFELNWLPKA